MEPDPIGFIGGMNIYAYVGNNPVNFVDPWGWCKKKKIYRVEIGGIGGGFGGYLEGGTMTLYDDESGVAYYYRYVAFGGGAIAGISVQPEVGVAWGSSNPEDWAGWGKAVAYEGISYGLSGAGGQIAWSGENIMKTSGPHAGSPGASGVYVSTYTWYVGEKRFK